MTYETYRYIFMGAAILCGIMLLITILLFTFLKIPKVIGDLSGSTAKKAIQSIREQNENTGDKTYKISTVNRNRGKLTDKISPSGRLIPSGQSPLGTGVVTEKINTQKLLSGEETTVMQSANETTVLNEAAAGETTVLNAAAVDEITVLNAGPGNETTVLSQEMIQESVFEIEFEITYIHTDEIIA